MSCAEAFPPLAHSPSRPRAGLDIGSRAAKLVVAGPQGILRQELMEAVPLVMAIRERGGLDRDRLGLAPDIPLVTTGYGKALVDEVRGISEIRAHFRGALAATGLRDFTLVELGGQDSKMIQVEGGRVLDFQTNDRCAAGTGRYLENMARLLGVDLADLAQADGAHLAEEPIAINNTCATFGETEVLARLVEGAELDRILAGVNLSVARRVAAMVRRHAPKTLVFAGGVAHNRAIIEMTRRLAGCAIIVAPTPQFNGALGCCYEEETL